ARLASGEEVTYHNGGGGDIGGLADGTKYYVIHDSEGKIKLAESAEKAAKGEAIDLTSAGSGAAHKLSNASTMFASAAAGAGSADVGFAGSFAMNASDVTTRAFVASTANITVSGDLNLDARSSSHVVTQSVPVVKDTGGNKTFGLGANVALSLVDTHTTASLDSGAALVGVDALKMTAEGEHSVSTEAKAGTKAGVALTPVVALTFTNHTTEVILDSGAALSLSAGLDASATQKTDVKTKAAGNAEGSGSFALGLAFALTSTNDAVSAIALRNVTTSGNASLKARGAAKSSTESEADAGGASQDTNKNASNGNADTSVDQQAQNQADLGNAQAANKGQQGGNGQGNPKAKNSDGPIAVAAAFAIGLADTDVLASVGNNSTLTSTDGTVTVSALANDDADATASGEATKAG
ncbi:MAG: hypothetical protein JNJ60_23280, partial [Rhodocyclaceae bacterium]|nr:hypothetical protein [Rhodocyclaceae bacterium]